MRIKEIIMIQANEEFDIAIIGAGPGGYVAAIKAAQRGKKVALIEKDALGGTCLNWGCIPTKTLLSSAKILQTIAHAKEFGISISSYSFDYSLIKKRKDEIVLSIRKSLEGLLKSHGVHTIKGQAKFTSAQSLKILAEKESFSLSAKKIIIASGSTTLDFKDFPCDHTHILNSTSILEMNELPSSLIIIGGGYIGCEFASLYADLGVKVTILEAAPSIISTQGAVLSSYLTKIFKDKGITILTDVNIKNARVLANEVIVSLADGKELKAEKALVSIGRKIVSDGLDIEKAGLTTSERKTLIVNDHMETEVSGIYAIGDVTGIAMLAHVASHQGIVAADNACGIDALMHYDAIPAVIFTDPEIATVGMTLEQALQRNIPATSGRFPFQALGKAQASSHTEGFAEIVIHTKTKQILGAQVVGHEASSLIGQMAVAIQNELTVECLIETIHPHPTMTEVWLEAALLATGMPIHLPPKTKKISP